MATTYKAWSGTAGIGTVSIDVLGDLGAPAREVSVAFDKDATVRVNSAAADQIPVEGSTGFGRSPWTYTVTDHDTDLRVVALYLEIASATTQYRVTAWA